MESDSGEPSFIDHDTSLAMPINVLDNPVWHALIGPHQVHAIGCGAARHYPRDVAPFSAFNPMTVCDTPGDTHVLRWPRVVSVRAKPPWRLVAGSKPAADESHRECSQALVVGDNRVGPISNRALRSGKWARVRAQAARPA